MQRCASAHFTPTGSLACCWAHAVCDLSLCYNTEAAELDKGWADQWVCLTPTPTHHSAYRQDIKAQDVRCFTSTVHKMILGT